MIFKSHLILFFCFLEVLYPFILTIQLKMDCYQHMLIFLCKKYRILLILTLYTFCRGVSKLCLSSYNSIDNDQSRAEESRSIIATISLLMESSTQLDGVDFTPSYAFVATWHKSIAFPYIFYGTHTTSPQVCYGV